ncbi:hypothetical protein F01_550069 [Burkholderia cenocepacia]|nr:hypothetical protein F01_550069 [Burkholderia cenocepacia]
MLMKRDGKIIWFFFGNENIF